MIDVRLAVVEVVLLFHALVESNALVDPRAEEHGNTQKDRNDENPHLSVLLSHFLDFALLDRATLLAVMTPDISTLNACRRAIAASITGPNVPLPQMCSSP